MKYLSILAALIGALLFAAGAARAFELEPGVNNAGMIDYPTALDQYLMHTVSGTVELIDAGAPDLAAENIRYGLQLGAFQVQADAYFLTEPKQEFDQGIVRAKLRILQFDPERTSIAVGGLTRLVTGDDGQDRIDHRAFSLLGVVTTELFPFQQWGGILLNGYLDNRVLDLGAKVQLYHFIKAVAEVDWYHSSNIDDKVQSKGGIEIEGQTSFFIQFIWSERFAHVLVTVGAGF
jgi:hypothetical protein